MLPAVVGMALLTLPFLGLLARTDWGRLPSLLGSPSARTALRLSVETAAASTLVCLLLGVPLAVMLARSTFRGAELVRSAVLVPLVLPPVVAGIALLAAFGRLGLLGEQLQAWGISIAFTTVAVVVAQSFVALPFLVISVEGALRTVGADAAATAATLGASPTVALFRVTLPAMRPALLSGTVLVFARALGEFGATITFAGSLQGVTRTLPLEIYLQREVDPDAAVAMSLLLVVVALAVIVAVRAWGRR